MRLSLFDRIPERQLMGTPEWRPPYEHSSSLYERHPIACAFAVAIVVPSYAGLLFWAFAMLAAVSQ